MPATEHDPKPGTNSDTAGTPPPRAGRLILAVLMISLLLFGTLEALYRAYWAYKREPAAAGGKGGYFSLYVIGESIAAGEPYDPGITPSGLVTAMLGGRVGGLQIKQFNLAKRGDSIYPQSVALEHALRRRGKDGPGAVLIYSGNSDAGSVQGLPFPEWLKENILSRSMLLSDISYYSEKRFSPLRVRTRDTYEHYMRRIVEMSLESGLTPILTTVPSNIADMDPGFLPGPDTERGEIIAILTKGRELETKKRNLQAIYYYSGQAPAHPRMRAYLAYRTGKCYQALGLYKVAGHYYREAAELSSRDNFNRATPAQNEMIRELAKRNSVPLVDAVEIFERNSPHGLLGNGLFNDGHHPNMTGYLLLTAAWAEKLGEVFHEPVKRRFSDPQEVFKFFAYDSRKQAAALVTTGRWFFNVAARHPWPFDRLKAAGDCFQRAVTLDPDIFSAWLGLGLTEAAVHGDLLSDEKKIDWLTGEGLGFYHMADYRIESGQLRGILARLASYGVPEALLKTISKKAAAADAGRGNTAAPGIFLPSTEKAPPNSPGNFLKLCRRLAAQNKKEEALHACQSAVFLAGSGAGEKIGDRMMASDASFESYKLLKALGREDEAVETLFWTIKSASPSWPGLAEAREAEKTEQK